MQSETNYKVYAVCENTGLYELITVLPKEYHAASQAMQIAEYIYNGMLDDGTWNDAASLVFTANPHGYYSAVFDGDSRWETQPQAVYDWDTQRQYYGK